MLMNMSSSEPELVPVRDTSNNHNQSAITHEASKDMPHHATLSAPLGPEDELNMELVSSGLD